MIPLSAHSIARCLDQENDKDFIRTCAKALRYREETDGALEQLSCTSPCTGMRTVCTHSGPQEKQMQSVRT